MSTAGINILIVEDEIIVARDIESKLKKIGYNVVDIVSTGPEAISKVGDTAIDLVLMDVTLEGKMDGIEAAGEINKLYNVAFVYITAHSDLDTLHRAKVTEPFGYIIKPFTQRDLIVTIGMALYKQRMEMKMKVINSILKVCLQSSTVQECLIRSLELVVSIPRTFLQTNGCIYLVGKDSRKLYRRAGLSSKDCDEVYEEECQCGKECDVVNVGECLCGLAASGGEIVFAERVDKRHTIDRYTFPHGHYCVPIQAKDQLLGVINVYVREGYRRDESDKKFLLSYAEILAIMLDQGKLTI